MRAAAGSGSQRLYGFRDILVLKVVKRLLDTGISLQQIRAAVAHLRIQGATDLAQVTLMSDGVSVYECTSDNEVVDLLARAAREYSASRSAGSGRRSRAASPSCPSERADAAGRTTAQPRLTPASRRAVQAPRAQDGLAPPA